MSEHVRALILPADALDAARTCHAALPLAATDDREGASLTGLSSATTPAPCSPSKLSTVLHALEHVLAVPSLDLPAARALLTRLVLDPAAVPQTQAAFSDILAEWRTAGIAC
ncbi:hypothetical protein AB0M57_21655 [Streptomyces sp. NPDC051597]|uniref:hypothetical protein n=1 Tax=Streptomyces sp. NPDC051597 TaxID=3155049 RepID=UPI0034241DD8